MTGDLPARLRKRFGRMVPEGDGWSHEWQTDELAEEAARRIELLENEVEALHGKVSDLNWRLHPEPGH